MTQIALKLFTIYSWFSARSSEGCIFYSTYASRNVYRGESKLIKKINALYLNYKTHFGMKLRRSLILYYNIFFFARWILIHVFLRDLIFLYRSAKHYTVSYIFWLNFLTTQVQCMHKKCLNSIFRLFKGYLRWMLVLSNQNDEHCQSAGIKANYSILAFNNIQTTIGKLSHHLNVCC